MSTNPADSDFACELNILQRRLRTTLIAETETASAKAFLVSQGAEGAWSDIDYADRQAQQWQPWQHLRRIRSLAAAYHQPDHDLFQNKKTLPAVERAIHFWVQRSPTSTNWWQHEVNINQELGAALILIKEDLVPEILLQGVQALCPVQDKWSAQNRIYTSFYGVYRALLCEDSTGLVEQVERIRGEARMKEGLGGVNTARNDNEREGIRRDHSFHQHGVALYNGFYGAHFVQDMCFWMKITDGLSFGFTEKEKQVMVDHILDGQQWMNRFGVIDPNTTNRKISHANYDYVTPRYHDPIVQGLSYLRDVPTTRSEEVDAFYQHQVKGAPSRIRGNRHFWKSDSMVQAGEGFQVSTKLWSSANLGTESLNGDNLQGLFLPLGGTFLLQDGKEYQDIFPVWNWGRVPGTTTLARDPGLPSPILGAPGNSNFSGGVSNGKVGAMVYDHQFDSVQARKSWFYFGDCVVLLGAGIRGEDAKLPVFTTLNQCHWRGEIYVGQSRREGCLPSGQYLFEDLNWVWHDRVAYLFPQQGKVFISAQTQRGSWHKINDTLSAEPLSHPVFTLGFDHGVAPQGATYAAVMVPGLAENEVAAWWDTKAVEILVNNSQIQAVRHRFDQVLQIAFYSPGTLSTDSGLDITVDHPCLIMVDERPRPVHLTVSDPGKTLGQLMVLLREPGGPSRQIIFHLPSGDEAGRSVNASDFPTPPASPCILSPESK